jgi:hypothetical protein
MNNVHWHLLLSHAPLFGAIGGFGLFAFAVIRKIKAVERAGLVILMLTALISIPVYLTGEGAEEAVEHSAAFSESAVEQHEEIAKTSFYVMLAMGGVALLAWFNRSFGKAAGTIRWVVVLMSFVTVCMVSATAWYGGKAGHEEVRGDSVWDLLSPGASDALTADPESEGEESSP